MFVGSVSKGSKAEERPRKKRRFSRGTSHEVPRFVLFLDWHDTFQTVPPLSFATGSITSLSVNRGILLVRASARFLANGVVRARKRRWIYDTEWYYPFGIMRRADI